MELSSTTGLGASQAELTIGTLVELVTVLVVGVDLQAVGLRAAGVLGSGWGRQEGEERERGGQEERCDHADGPGLTGLDQTDQRYHPACRTAATRLTTTRADQQAVLPSLYRTLSRLSDTVINLAKLSLQ